MTARVLIVSDDELALLVSWAQITRQDDEFDEDDEELLAKIEAAMLR